MPSGAKKRKALKRKQQQQGAIGGATTSTTNHKGFNGDNNLHGNDEHGRGSDDSSLSSSPGGSQGNEEFGEKDSPAAAALSSSGMVKDAAKEISRDGDVTQGLGPKRSGNAVAVERGTDYKKSVVGKSTNSSSENTAKHVACGNPVTEITPVVESVKPVVVVPLSKAVTSEKSEHVDETSTHSSLVKKKSEKNGESLPSPGLENNNSKVVVTLPRSAAETSKNVESVSNSEVPVSSEEKCLLLPGPPVVRRTSWLSCCGLFDAMTGSDR
ncbi:PREDICTED: uncharacterized protein LOC104776982 [Camelina sativa]|uniref:Uncharacterized protein LOC104776982 n=1 Tax=Camelina sativa TaxID=90675 RepID=A0ABM1RJS9_CAMSA|nr:PREDICTED: uncharacterized protein LOC104776982 [Camelina sativa]